jgi:hypothetical protein
MSLGEPRFVASGDSMIQPLDFAEMPSAGSVGGP